MNQLQKSLRMNAIFSGTSGTLLVVLNSQIAQVFEVSNSSVFWITGAALLFFAATIIYEVKKQNPSRVLFIIIQDLLWVLGSILLLVLQPFGISPQGNALIAGIGVVVLFMAINQARALFYEKPKTS